MKSRQLDPARRETIGNSEQIADSQAFAIPDPDRRMAGNWELGVSDEKGATGNGSRRERAPEIPQEHPHPDE